MSSSLPLAALHTFVEVVRAGSMKQAAEALCVSPGAVSQQIRNLEERLAMPLFVRGARELTPTDAARAFYARIAPQFLEIGGAWDALRGEPGRGARLNVTTTASFAGNWLIPRLAAFQAAYPELDIEIDSGAALVDLRRGHADIAIRHGLGDYPGHAVWPLWAPELWPVCSPALLDSSRPVHEPADCLAYPLLQDADRADWTLWLRAFGTEDARASRGTRYSDDTLLIRAALSGQGIALVRDVYARDDVAAGRLVRVIERPWPTRFAYYAVCDAARRDEWKIVAFREWLQQVSEPAGEPSNRMP
ncbi:LysR substrate-binding domain-containing protein [Burkholderia sp. 22PA0099]|uniref:LysR substrate-binding domain-containing protein n=1 Tax=Burkholderia sp. 22PA0099 TaxID=3237372 RepID=UPI0039C2CE33